MDYKIEPKDVVQVVRKNHPLFQSLLVVDEVVDGRVDAHYFIPNRNSYESLERKLVACQVSAREVGVIGKVIV